MSRTRKLKTPNVRAGDRVRIITPSFFVRCGYPLDFFTECERIRNSKKKSSRIKPTLTSDERRLMR